MKIRAVVFDAYGTLFDVYSIRQLAEEIFPGKGQAISVLWRDTQISYTRLRSLSDQYVNFWHLTADALRFTCLKLELELKEVDFDRLMGQYARLQAFEEDKRVLEGLRQQGLKTAILSNGNVEMLEAAVQAGKLEGLFDFIISADSVRKYKTAAEVYQLGPDILRCEVDQILFVSSNCWDACGATWFGYTTFWVNRAGDPVEQLGVNPHYIGKTLDDIFQVTHG